MTDKIMIDVRESDEFQAQHIPSSINIPLTKLGLLVNYKPLLSGKQVLLVCKSGRRAGMAKEKFDAQDIVCDVVEGGLDRWVGEGKPVVKNSINTLSIFRQVQIIVGFLVAIFGILGALVNPGFIWGAVVLGGALGIAGLFGFCLLAELLNKMPWNK